VSTETASAASRAIAVLLDLLADAGIAATRDAGAVYPQPTAVLVGLPELVRRSLSARVFTIPVSVISGDPFNSELAVDRVYALADEIALTLSTDTYRPSSWRSSVNAEPLPAVELTVTVTVTEGS
jgi:hypothetical protein